MGLRIKRCLLVGMLVLVWGFLVSRGQVFAAEGEVRALFVTRGVYNGYNDLTPAPENDGENLQRLLMKSYGSRFSVESAVTRAREGVTTKAGVTQEIQAAFADSQAGDINYFFYSGHGNPSGLALGSGTMTASDLAAAFAGIEGKNILVVDCCYSGALASKGARSAAVSEDQFLAAFIAEFEQAVAAVEYDAGPRSRSALADSRFKLLMASSAEELSWQGGIAVGNEDIGLFSAALVMGCGIDATLVSQAEGYQLETALADANLDGSVSLSEIYSYIGDVNQMSHVRVYPERDNGEFMPLAAAEIPKISFQSLAVVYDQAFNALLQVNYYASAAGTVEMALYLGEDWPLSLLIKKIPGNGRFTKYSGMPQLSGTKDIQITEAGSGSFTVALPFNADALAAGDYALMLKTSIQGAKSILPFHLTQAVNSTLAQNFQLKLSSDEYMPAAKELEITADFGTAVSENIDKPALSCYILDSDENVVRTLGENEWMEVVGTGFDQDNNMIRANCYKKFYWDGTDDNGNTVPGGIYTVELTAAGAVNDTKRASVAVGNLFSEVTLSASTIELPLTADDPGLAAEVEVAAAGQVKAQIVGEVDGNEQVIKEIAAVENQQIYKVSWDGFNDKGIVPDNGRYYVRMIFTPVSGVGSFTRNSPAFNLTRAAFSLTNVQPTDAAGLDFRENGSREILRYQINYPTRVRVSLYDKDDIQVVALLPEQAVSGGDHAVSWDGILADGSVVKHGWYYFKVEARSVIDGTWQEVKTDQVKIVTQDFGLDEIRLSDTVMEYPDGNRAVTIGYSLTCTDANVLVQIVECETDRIARNLYDQNTGTQKEGSVIWDGNKDDGTAAAAGRYYVKVAAEFYGESAARESAEITLTREEMQLSDIVLPDANELDFTAAEEQKLVSYRVNYDTEVTAKLYNENGTGTVLVIKDKETVNAGEHVINFTGSGADGYPLPSGKYRFKLMMLSPLDGREQEMLDIPLDIVSQELAITDLTLTADTLKYPGGIAETTLTYNVNYPNSDVTVTVFKQLQSKAVKELFRGRISESGQQTVSWRGDTDTGDAAPEGSYYIEVKVQAGSRSAAAESIVIRLLRETVIEQPETKQTETKQTETKPPIVPPKKEPVKPPVQPTGVKVKVGSKTIRKITIGQGEKIFLKPVVTPGNAANKAVTYKTSNKKIVSVTKQGRITGRKSGRARITVSTRNGKKAVLTVTVKKAPRQIKLPAKSKTLRKGRSYKLKVKFPARTASYQLTYHSNKKRVAKVDKTGRVRALRKGRAVITVKTFNGRKAKIRIVVK